MSYQGLIDEKFGAAMASTWSGDSEGLESPIPLDGGQPIKMDRELLPGIVGDMARAVSVETETPIELAASLALSVLATACQRKMILNIKPGYDEPLNIWTNTPMDPANRKSSVHKKMTDPLTQWELRKGAEYASKIKEASITRENQEARVKSLRQKYGRAKKAALEEIAAEILEIERDLVPVPSVPKIWAQDVTPEHLGTLLNTHGEAMSILSSEGGIFDILGGRYSNGIPNLDLFLQGHAGDPVRVDRGSREPVYLNSPSLTLGLSPQPAVLRALIDKPGFRGKGLLARFLYLLPKSKLGFRKLDSEPVPVHVSGNYFNLISCLLEIEPEEDENGQIQPYVLKLSAPAYQTWLNFSKDVEKELREGGWFENITDWAGKLPGAIGRIAGLLHCAENPQQPWKIAVSEETMKIALEFANVFADHAMAAFNLMGADQTIEQAKKVWRWVERGRFANFSKRDCFKALQGTFKRVANIDTPLDILVERNFIKMEKLGTGGRPTIKYEVNPAITKQWA